MSSLCSFNHPITLSSKRGSSSSKINDGFFSRSLFSEVLIVLVLKLVIIKGKRPSTGSAYCTEKALLLLLWSCHIMVFQCRKKSKENPSYPIHTQKHSVWKFLKSLTFISWPEKYGFLSTVSGGIPNIREPLFCCFPGYISSNHQRNPQVTVHIIVFQSIFLALCC